MTDFVRPTRPDLTCDEVRDLAASFVLGALDDDELDAVRAHLATCADAHLEMAELGGLLPVLADSVPIVEPPAGLKARILAAAAEDLEARRSEAAVDGAGTVRFPTAAEREARSAGRTTSRGTWLLRIAAALAIVLLGGWNLLLQGQLNVARTHEQDVAAVLDAAGQPGALTAILRPQEGTGAVGIAAVDQAGNVKLAMRDLAPTAGNEVYEAWVIGSDGNPVALGSFRVGQDGVAYFEGQNLPTQAGIVLALTREPGPGATTPTMPIVSLGTATAAG